MSKRRVSLFEWESESGRVKFRCSSSFNLCFLAPLFHFVALSTICAFIGTHTCHFPQFDTPGAPALESSNHPDTLRLKNSLVIEGRAANIPHVKKADDDLRTLEESIMTLKGRENGKAKAVCAFIFDCRLCWSKQPNSSSIPLPLPLLSTPNSRPLRPLSTCPNPAAEHSLNSVVTQMTSRPWSRRCNDLCLTVLCWILINLPLSRSVLTLISIAHHLHVVTLRAKSNDSRELSFTVYGIECLFSALLPVEGPVV